MWQGGPRLPIVVTCLALLLAACGGSAPTSSAGATPSRASVGTSAISVTRTSSVTVRATGTSTEAKPLTAVFPMLATALPEASSLQIKDDWSGYAPVYSKKAGYLLTRTGEGFEGRASFSAKGDPFHLRLPTPVTKERAATRDITVPLDAARTFLNALATVSVQEGAWVRNCWVTDTYYKVEFDLETTAGPVRFSLDAPYKEWDSPFSCRPPWHVSFAGRVFRIDSYAPTEALKKLDPHLQKDVLKGLVDSLENEWKAEAAKYTPTPVLCRAPAVLNTSPAPPQGPVVAPSPAPSPSPPLNPAQAINPVEHFGLDRTRSLRLEGRGMDGASPDRKLTSNPGHIRAIVAALNYPMMSVPPPEGSDRTDQDRIDLTFDVGGATGFVRLIYWPKVAIIENVAIRPPLSVQAPPELATVLTSHICGR